MFNDKSRYRNTEQYPMKDRKGRTVQVVAVPDAVEHPILGSHQLMQGQRTDHLAAHYTKDEAGFWRIADANDKMLTEALSEQPVIAIPEK